MSRASPSARPGMMSTKAMSSSPIEAISSADWAPIFPAPAMPIIAAGQSPHEINEFPKFSSLFHRLQLPALERAETIKVKHPVGSARDSDVWASIRRPRINPHHLARCGLLEHFLVWFRDGDLWDFHRFACGSRIH